MGDDLELTLKVSHDKEWKGHPREIWGSHFEGVSGVLVVRL
jgi:hypothetical protein